MKRTFFTALEQHSSQEPLALSSVINELAFNEQGLIPVITQDANSNEILMFAWMNLDALKQTIATKRVTYWSRSRQQLWVKGDTSGHTQKLLTMSFDCDGDVILCKVEQQGAACHTGRTSCFYLNVDIEQDAVIVQGHKI